MQPTAAGKTRQPGGGHGACGRRLVTGTGEGEGGAAISAAGRLSQAGESPAASRAPPVAGETLGSAAWSISASKDASAVSRLSGRRRPNSRTRRIQPGGLSTLTWIQPQRALSKTPMPVWCGSFHRRPLSRKLSYPFSFEDLDLKNFTLPVLNAILQHTAI